MTTEHTILDARRDTLWQEVIEYIEGRNEARGPFGISVDVLDSNALGAVLQFSVTDRNGATVWKLTHPERIYVGGAFSITGLRNAFLLNLNEPQPQVATR